MARQDSSQYSESWEAGESVFFAVFAKFRCTEFPNGHLYRNYTKLYGKYSHINTRARADCLMQTNTG